jgi:Spy/CpxP family protein refolding chaperone
MKKGFILALLALGLTTAKAQDSTAIQPPAGKRMPAHHREKNFQSLNLTEEQQNKIAELRKEHHQKMMEVLTPDQRKQFEAQQTRRRQDHRKRAAARMDKLTQQLQLTPEQQTAITALNQDFRQKAALIKANETLSAAAQRKQFKELASTHQAEVKALLSQEQQSQWEAIRNQRRQAAGR